MYNRWSIKRLRVEQKDLKEDLTGAEEGIVNRDC